MIAPIRSSRVVPMSDLIRRHPLIAYFIIAYAGSWIIWASHILSLDGMGLLPFHSPFSYMLTISIGTFTGPAVSAFIVAAATEGAAGVRRLLSRIVQWRVGLAWYLFIFIGFPLIEVLGVIAVPGVMAKVTPVDWLPELAAAVAFFVYPGLLAGPIGEEIGWRGVALPRLQSRHGPVMASLVLGLLWAFWHAPLWFSGQWAPLTLANVATYVVWITAATFIFTWVFNNTQGSVLMAILLHGVMDVFPNAFILPHLPSAGEMTASGALAMYWGLAIGFGVFAGLLLVFTRGRLGLKGSLLPSP